ncbi:MAG: hypothetical protein WA919_06140 [Coleofasciculaceae cyanobacterium]
MSVLHKIVNQVLKSGYLTVEAEEQVRALFASSSNVEDIEALVSLQKATSSGRVRQQSQELVGLKAC